MGFRKAAIRKGYTESLGFLPVLGVVMEEVASGLDHHSFLDIYFRKYMLPKGTIIIWSVVG